MKDTISCASSSSIMPVILGARAGSTACSAHAHPFFLGGGRRLTMSWRAVCAPAREGRVFGRGSSRVQSRACFRGARGAAAAARRDRQPCRAPAESHFWLERESYKLQSNELFRVHVWIGEACIGADCTSSIGAHSATTAPLATACACAVSRRQGSRYMQGAHIMSLGRPYSAGACVHTSALVHLRACSR